MTTFGVKIRKEIPAALGNMATQAIVPAAVSTTPTSNIVPISVRVPSEATPVVPTQLNETQNTLAPNPNIARTQGTIGNINSVKTANLQIPSITISSYQKRPVAALAYTQDSMRTTNTTIENNEYVLDQQNGISAYRPEILGIIDFQPVLHAGTTKLTAAGKLVDLNYQARILRENTLYRIFNEMLQQPANQNDLAQRLKDLNSDFALSLADTKRIIDFYNQNIIQINGLKKTFDVKTTNSHLEDFFEKKMQFSKSAFAVFSDTKILEQLVFDFRSIAEGYSLDLLNLSDNDRIGDLDPTKLDTTYTQQDNFSFTVSSIRSPTNARNAAQTNEFAAFYNSLPANHDDKIKLLVTLLSKELRVSKGLSKNQNRRKIQEFFQGDPDGNPFDNVMGTVGNTIFDAPIGVNSLASLFQLPIGDTSFVLPFEQKVIDDKENIFVSGERYFIDSILNLNDQGRFNVKPYVDYVSKFNDIWGNTKGIVRDLFELDTGSKLNPVNMLNSIILGILSALDGINKDTQNNKDQFSVLSLFRFSNNDRQLKLMLFQFLLLVGIATNSDKDDKKVFKRLIADLNNTIKSLNAVVLPSSNNASLALTAIREPDLNGGIAELYPYIEKLAEAIEQKVLALTNQSTTVGTQGVIKNSKQTFDVGLGGKTQKAKDFNSGIVSTGVSTNTSLSQNLISLPLNTIKNALLNTVNPRLNASANLAKEFIDLAHLFDDAASINGNDLSYTLSDDTGRTRYNYISTSYLLLSLFEIMCSITQKYFAADFVAGTSSDTVFVKLDTDRNNYIVQTLNNLFTKQIKELTKIPNKTALVPSKVASSGTANGLISSVFTQQQSNVPYSRVPGELVTISSLPLTTPSSNQSNAIVNRVGQSQTQLDVALALAANPFVGLNANANVIGSIVSNTSANTNIAQFTSLRNAIEIVKLKLSEEESVLNDIIAIFDTVNTKITQGANNARNYFESASDNKILLTSEYKGNLFESQLEISNWRYDLYKDAINKSPNGILTTDVVSTDERNAIFAMLKSKSFVRPLAKSRVKLLPVGIPAGFTERLTDRISKSSITANSLTPQDADVVYINVYKRSADNDDIIYKPQKFIVDLSLFYKPLTNLNVNPNESFNQIVNRAEVCDYSTGTKNTWTMDKVNSDPKYNTFLSQTDRYNMFSNTIVSGLLQTYMMLMTGIKFTEDTFTKELIQVGTEINPLIESLVKDYYELVKRAPLPSATIPEILLDKQVSEEVKDDLKLMFFGGTTLKGDLIQKRILAPKLFDKVVILPIDIDSFFIDNEATTKQQSGKQSLAKDSVQKKLKTAQVNDQEGYQYLDRSMDPNALVFEDFFVTIETVK